jgi:transposase
MMLEYFAQQPPCEIGIETCGGAHYGARELTKLGRTVKLIAPHYGVPYRTAKGKNDTNDAEAICEAMARPKTRIVPVERRAGIGADGPLGPAPWWWPIAPRR